MRASALVLGTALGLALVGCTSGPSGTPPGPPTVQTSARPPGLASGASPLSSPSESHVTSTSLAKGGAAAPASEPGGGAEGTTALVGRSEPAPSPSTRDAELATEEAGVPAGQLEVRSEYYKYLREYKFVQNASSLEEKVRGQDQVGLLHALHGGALIDCGRDVEGKAEVARALRLEPRCALAYVFLGNQCAFTGRLEEAQRHFGRACSLAKVPFDRSVAQSSLGNLRFWQGDLVRARLHYEGALASARDFTVLRSRLYQQLALVAELEHKPRLVYETLRRGFQDEHRMGPFTQLVEYALVTGQPHLVDVGVLKTLPEEDGHSLGLLYYTRRLLVRRDLQLGLVERALREGYPTFANVRSCYPTDLVRLVRLNMARPPAQRLKPTPLDADHCSLAYAHLYAGRLVPAASLLDRDDPAEQGCSRWYLYRVVLKELQGRPREAEAACRAKMRQDASIINMLVYLNLLQMRQQWSRIIRFVHPRRDPTLSLVALRAMLRSYDRVRLRKLALPVAILSERNIGPGPEHVALWRALYRPPEVRLAPPALDWETW